MQSYTINQTTVSLSKPSTQITASIIGIEKELSMIKWWDWGITITCVTPPKRQYCRMILLLVPLSHAATVRKSVTAYK